MMKKIVIVGAVLIALIISRFIIRIVDATVQIGGNYGILVLLLLIINGTIAGIAYIICRKKK